MTKKSTQTPSFSRLSDFLSENKNLNIRVTVKAVRNAFKEGELDLIQIDTAFKLDDKKGLVGAQPGERGIIYDFIIFNEDEFNNWMEENKVKFLSNGSGNAPKKLTDAEVIELRTSNPPAYEEYRDNQRKAMKIYAGPNSNPISGQLGDIARMIADGMFPEALVALNKIHTRKNSPNAAIKANYASEIAKGLRRQEEDRAD